MRRAVSTVVSPFASLTACVGVAGSSGSTAALVPSASAAAQRRFYRWNIADDLVPAGAKTSPFQSSNVPSERRRVIQEYAVAPLFGARISALVVGSVLSPREFVAKKKGLAALFDEVLGLPAGTVTLGETRWLSDAVLPRPTSPDFRRLDPRTGETVAACLVGVYLPSEMDLFEQLEIGTRLADMISGASPDPRIVADRAVSYCEFEAPDLRSYTPEELLGEAVDPDEAAAALDRWMDRIEDQVSVWEAMRATAGSTK